MKLADLERHLRQQGCVFFREGGAHTFIRDGWVSLTNLRAGQDLTYLLKDFATHEQCNLIVVN